MCRKWWGEQRRAGGGGGGAKGLIDRMRASPCTTTYFVVTSIVSLDNHISIVLLCFLFVDGMNNVDAFH